MCYTDMNINCIEWSRHGTVINIGYRSSESDGLEDDWVLGDCNLIVSNEEIDPFIGLITDHFRLRMEKAISEDLPK